MCAARRSTSPTTRSRSPAASPASGSSRSRSAGLAGQRDADLHEALAAVGQLIDRRRLEAREAEEIDQRPGFGVDPLEVLGAAQEMEATRVPGLDGEPQVLLDREPLEQIGDLERAGDAAGAKAIRREAVDPLAAQQDLAGIRRIQAGDDIEQRGLAGAVRADQRLEPRRHHGQRHVGDRPQPPEALVDGAAFEQRRGGAIGRARAQKRRHFRARLRARARRHRRNLLGLAPERRQEARAEADQAHRREQDESHEQEAEIELPGRGVAGEDLAEQDEEQSAERRAQEIAHAADHGHGDDLARERHVDHVRGDEIAKESKQAARETEKRGRENEPDQLVTPDRIADEGRPLLVLADRHQHPPERRVDEPPDTRAREEYDQGTGK